MFSLENGQQYALSSNPSTADILQLESKTYVFLKLTDSAYKTIEEHQKTPAKSQKCVNKPKIQFTGDTGVIKIPADQNESRSYKFTLAQVEPSTSSTCLEHDGIRSGSRDIETLGTMGHKITICADNDVYQQTRDKMTLAEEENKKICTKEIKPSAGSKYRAKLNKKISRSVPAPLPKPEIKSAIMERILAQKHAKAANGNTKNCKAANAKPARVAHRPNKPSDSPTILPAKTESKPKVDERASVPPVKVSLSPEKKADPLSRQASNIREETLKRPGPPVEANAAKKARHSETERTPESKTNIVDNAASHWKKQPLNQNQNSRNFFSDRRSPDCRPKLAVPPMPAPKPGHNDGNARKREESMKENHNVGSDDHYSRNYTEILSMVQRLRYKQDFNNEYEEYQKLHANISSVSRRFQRMENDLKSAEEGTKMHEKIKKAIVQEYVNYKKDPRYVKDKSRFDHLHKKLSHIKKLIVDYDQRQITSQ